MSYTPGPWEIVRIPDLMSDTRVRYSIEAKDSPYWVAIVGAPADSDLVAKANSKLIAAAPDLLEALEITVDRLDDGSAWSDENLYEIRDIIAKAKGGVGK